MTGYTLLNGRYYKMTVEIASINLSPLSIINGRTVAANNPRSLDVNWIDGSIAAIEPLTDNGIIKLYPQNPNNTAYTTTTISELPGYLPLDLPTGIVFDSTRNKIWIADRRNRVMSMDKDSQEVLSYTKNINLPYALSADINTGGVFILGYKNLSTGIMTYLEQDGSINSTIEFPHEFPSAQLEFESTIAFVNSLPSPHSITYDHVRSRIWWLALTTSYMMDVATRSISTYDLSAHSFVSLQTVNIDLQSGNTFITAKDETDYYVVQMSKGNDKYFGRSWMQS